MERDGISVWFLNLILVLILEDAFFNVSLFFAFQNRGVIWGGSRNILPSDEV